MGDEGDVIGQRVFTASETQFQATFDLAAAIGREDVAQWKSLRFVEEVLFSPYGDKGGYDIHCRSIAGTSTAETVDLQCDLSHAATVKFLFEGYEDAEDEPS